MKRKKKWGKALWTTLPGRRPPRRPRRQDPSAVRRYRIEARAWIAQLRSIGTRCPVVETILGERLLVDQVHHVRGRLGPLLLDKRYWLAVSGPGHWWIGRNPAEAAKRGWLARKGEWGRAD